MRNAPSVRFPVGRCVFYGGLLIGLSLCGLAAVVAGWFFLTPPAGLVGLLLWAGAAVLAGMDWLRSPVGHLQWDARASRPEATLSGTGGWVWHSTAYQDGVALRRVERVQDLQHWMLLRMHNPDGARIWVWVERASDSARWDDLRRALMARH